MSMEEGCQLSSGNVAPLTFCDTSIGVTQSPLSRQTFGEQKACKTDTEVGTIQ